MAQVLVLDNESMTRESVRLLFEYEGYGVVVAADGAEALEVLRRCLDPVVVVLDAELPNVSGIDVLRRAREDAQLRRHAYVVWTTGRVHVPEELLAVLGAPLLLKPYTSEALLAAVGWAAARLDFQRPDEYDDCMQS